MNEAHKAAEEDVIVIDFAQLAKALWQRFWIVIVVTLMGCSLTYLGTKAFVQPTYRATFTAYVNNKSSSEGATTVTNSDLTAAQSLVYTYTHILTSRTMLTAAAAQVGENYSYDEMSKWVTTNVIDDTEIIEVCVTMDSAEGALTLAEAIAEIMPDYVTQIVEGSSVQIIDMPVLPDSIYSPSYLKNAAIGGLIGAFLVAAMVVLRELLDDTVKDEAALERRFGAAVIGVIPDWATAGKLSNHYAEYGQQKPEQAVAGKRVMK
ncbi:MAG: Wzz/FepE/Etk N-terminal domain-containing protein [Lachnospiraceae bacterium]|nr:Wzz/FepE/Etk N-terminal domain-containing protein [Lachnospiraceae bacterium]